MLCSFGERQSFFFRINRPCRGTAQMMNEGDIGAGGVSSHPVEMCHLLSAARHVVQCAIFWRVSFLILVCVLKMISCIGIFI